MLTSTTYVISHVNCSCTNCYFPSMINSKETNTRAPPSPSIVAQHQSLTVDLPDMHWPPAKSTDK